MDKYCYITEEKAMKRTSRFIKTLIAVAVSLTCIITFMPHALATDTVVITASGNPHLYAALHAAPYNLDPGPSPDGNIMQSEMQALTGTLDLSGCQLDNLAGLSSANHIDRLILNNNPGITNLTPIYYMPSITELSLNNDTGITAFPDMSYMTKLNDLTLWGCTGLNNADMNSLLALPVMKDGTKAFNLLLNGTNITDVSCFTPTAAPGLKNLSWGSASFNATAIGTLQGCTQLTDLYLDGDSNIGNAALPYIDHLTNLRILDIASCGISDLSGIKDLSLATLLAGDNSIKSLSPLKSMDLGCLYIPGNLVSDLSDLSGMDLTQLYAEYNYLDPTDGSSDRAVMDSITGNGGTADYTNQYQLTVNYDTDSKGTAAKASDTVYYGQSVTLPAVSNVNAGYTFKGWDTNGDQVMDHAAGSTVAIAPTLPIPSNTLSYTAKYNTTDAISQATNPHLYNALMAFYSTQVGHDHPGYITDGELESLTGSLTIPGVWDITSIEGLQDCQNITALYLDDNTGLTDLSPFNYHEMTQLQTLSLMGCGSKLSLPDYWDMPNLENLYISDNSQIDDGGGLEPVALLPKLETLLLRNCSEVEGFDDLRHMSWLRTLMIEGSDLKALPDMSEMSGLIYLDLRSTEDLIAVSNLHAGLLSLPNLKAYSPSKPFTLDISQTNLKEIDFLTPAAAPGLYMLMMQNMPFTSASDFSKLAVLTQLKTLDMGNNQGAGSGIGDGILQYLDGLSNVNNLGVSNCGITDLTGIQDMHLNNLSISRNAGLKSLSPVSGMSLDALYASGCCIYDLDPLMSMYGLTTIDVSQNYLDPTAGSDDRAVLDAIATRPGASVDYSWQQQITVSYVAPSPTSTPSKPSDTVYYGQRFILPGLSSMDTGMAFIDWDTNGDMLGDTLAGATIQFSWPTLPIPGKAVTFQGYQGGLNPDFELAGITASKPMSPAFSPTVSTYSISLPASVPSVTLTATLLTPSDSKITMNGDAVTTKTYTVACGTTVTADIYVFCTSGPNNGWFVCYCVNITRATAEGTTLQGLGNNVGTLNKPFDPYTTSYKLELPEGTGSVTFTPDKSNPASTVKISPSKTVSLKNGQTKTVTIKVTYQKKSKTYTVKVTRAASTNCSIPDVTGITITNCSPAFVFDDATGTYTATVLENKSSVKVKVTKGDPTEIVRINGSKATSKTITINNAAYKTVTVTITAQAGSPHITKYTITLVRPPHISSFTATPKVAGKYTLQLTAPAKPFKFSYALAAKGGTAVIEIDTTGTGTWVQIGTATYTNGGTKTLPWDGTVPGTTLTPGTAYNVRLTVTYTYNAVSYTAASKTISVTVK